MGDESRGLSVERARRLALMGDAQLERRLRALAYGEKQVLAGFLRHLAEFDRRRAHAPRGYPSLFRYCTRELGLSEDEAYLRIHAARLSRDYPEILGMLSRGETHLSCLSKLSPCLTRANASALLEESRGKSKREVERIAARFADGPAPKADAIRYLPAPCASAPAGRLDSALSPAAPNGIVAAAAPPEPQVAAPQRWAAAPEPSAKPETAQRRARLVRIAFTASENLLAKIEKAKALMRHKHPTGRLELLVGEAFDALLAQRDPDRKPSRERRGREPESEPRGRSRHIPLRVREEVWRRDGGRCTFVSSEGKRCEAQDWLEYDHIVPFALGGSSTDPANLRLSCRTHNSYAARVVFGSGPWWKPRKIRREATPKEPGL